MTGDIGARPRFRVLSVIPGASAGPSMIFAKRQALSLPPGEVTNRTFFLATRTSPLGVWAEFRRFRAEIRQFQPQVVHAHFGTVTALFCALATRLPLVITFYGSDLNPVPSMSGPRTVLAHSFSHLAALRARQIICVTPQLRQRLRWRRRNIHVIPTGVDTSVFKPAPRDEARRTLGWPLEDRVVLFNAGRAPAVKRLDLAQAAVEEARKIDGRIRFVVLDGLVDPLQLPTIMNGSDCLLVTSDWEGSPTVVQEAMACDLPVVSVDVGDVRERLSQVHPSTIAPRKAPALGRAVAEMVARPQRSNGTAKVDGISLRTIVPRLVALYRAASKRAP